jgi:elongin-A
MSSLAYIQAYSHQNQTTEIWKALCFRTYPTAAERYHHGETQEPESWKNQYFVGYSNFPLGVTSLVLRTWWRRKHGDLRKWERKFDGRDRKPRNVRKNRR